MKYQVLVGLHIQRRNGRVKLNTKKPYFWRITNKTVGEPHLGYLALVDTGRRVQHVVVLSIENTDSEKLYKSLERDAFKFENRRSHHQIINNAFEAYIVEGLTNDET